MLTEIIVKRIVDGQTNGRRHGIKRINGAFQDESGSHIKRNWAFGLHSYKKMESTMLVTQKLKMEPFKLAGKWSKNILDLLLNFSVNYFASIGV